MQIEVRVARAEQEIHFPIFLKICISIFCWQLSTCTVILTRIDKPKLINLFV